jgi:uncharacterized protein YegL
MSDMNDFEIGSGFGFSGQIIDQLEASEYTLVTIALDETGSISGYETQIEEMLKTAVAACNSSPYSQNLLVRVLRFGTQYQGGIDEIHGFKALSEIDINTYPTLRGGGGTPLYDAVYSAVGAMNVYAQSLVALDFAVNGITFVITDGENTHSIATPKMVKDELKKSVTGEIMESHLSILIGIGTGSGSANSALQTFQTETGMNQFIWAGEATKGKLAKLAEFVSQSISSTSQALGTGGPSKQISATI